MSLVDITPLPAEDESMDPATRQYVDTNLAVAVAQSEARLADFRATMQAYTARAEERDAATREQDQARAKEFERRMEAISARAEEREAAAREQERAHTKEFERRLDERDAAARERDAAAREREAAAREREDIRAKNFERLMAAYEAKADARHQASEARFDRIEKRLDQIEASIASLKKFIVGASLSTVLGVAAFNAALIQNYHAAFDSARYLSGAEKDMMAQRQRSDALLAAMEARLAAMEKSSSQRASPP